MSEIRTGITLALFFLTAIGTSVAGIIYLSVKWPLYFFPALLLLVAASVICELRSKRKILDILGTRGYVDIVESQPDRYTGIYRPHWEIGHIQIPLAERSMLGFPAFESWCPRLSESVTEGKLDDDDMFEGAGQFLITFIGTPSKRGQYGHMGMMDRKVTIEAIVELMPLEESV